MNPRVYIETTVVSYLTAKRSSQLLMAAHQDATRIWWDDERQHFDLFVSDVVLDEASGGDPQAAEKRLAALAGIPELEVTSDARDLAKLLVERTPLPEKAAVDALHIATAAVHGMDYLLTWNCRHIANATFRSSMSIICEDAGYVIPVICTPLELIEEHKDD